MNINKMWSEFDRAIMNSPADRIMEILYSAALKKLYEIQELEDVDEIDSGDSFVRNLVASAIKRRRHPNEQLKYIKTYCIQDINDL